MSFDPGVQVLIGQFAKINTFVMGSGQRKKPRKILVARWSNMPLRGWRMIQNLIICGHYSLP